MKKLINILLLMSTFYFSSAQKPDKLIMIGLSPNAYKGDLGSYSKWTPAFHIGLKFNKKEKINGYLNASYGTVTGENAKYTFNDAQEITTPNRFFVSTFFAVNYELQYNIYRYNNFTFYAGLGIGLIGFKPQDEFFNSLVDQAVTRAEGETYSNTSIMFPTSIGVTYHLPNHYAIGFSAGFLNTFSDYLDNISEWGIKKGNDNILSIKFSIYVPLLFKIKNLSKKQKEDN